MWGSSCKSDEGRIILRGCGTFKKAVLTALHLVSHIATKKHNTIVSFIIRHHLKKLELLETRRGAVSTSVPAIGRPTGQSLD